MARSARRLAAAAAMLALGRDGGGSEGGRHADGGLDAAPDAGDAAGAPPDDGRSPEAPPPDADASAPPDGAVGDADVGGPDASDGDDPDALAPDGTETSNAPEVDAGPPPAPELLLTVSRIPPSMNGSQPYSWEEASDVPFTLRVNRRRALQLPPAVSILEPILPMTGDPIGTHPVDEAILQPDFDPDTASPEAEERHELLELALDLTSLGFAVTLAHEMGHSLGLVPYGPPPQGLFAEMPGLPFTESDLPGAHLDTPGLNVMQTGQVTSFLDALGGDVRFSALSMAYLRRELVVGPPAEP